jgi:hypothetical protein
MIDREFLSCPSCGERVCSGAVGWMLVFSSVVCHMESTHKVTRQYASDAGHVIAGHFLGINSEKELRETLMTLREHPPQQG